MSPGGFRRPICAVLAFALAIVVGVSVAAVWPAGSASAATTSPLALSVSVDRPLSLLSEAVVVTAAGELSRSLVGTKLVVRVEGPAALDQVGHSDAGLHEADKIVQTLGQQAATEGEGQPAPDTGADADLKAGKLNVTVALPAGTPAAAGGYLLLVELKSGSEVVARGQAWIGKVTPRETPLDLAFVWPVSLGIHRDSTGAFYDDVLERAIASDGQGEDSLRALLTAAERFPAWNLTLAIEPVLLTQLRDMADGYTMLDGSGKRVLVAADDPRAQNADTVLAAFRDLAARGTVETAASPYSGADLSLLAAAGWRDGFEQVQMGKQELQQTLALDAPLTSGYSPDLGLTSDSLGCYAQASIDHVVVGDALAKQLTEPAEEGAVAVRARDVQNDRVTLVFADTAVSSAMGEPWDAGALFAALAARLAATPRDALVLAPAAQFTTPPQSYLEAIGRTLAGLDWVRTRTLTQLLRAHSPGTRPVMLNAAATPARGYVQTTLIASLEAAHAAVTDLAAVADPTRTQVDAAHRLLYMAESRWWWRLQTSPAEATIGLHFGEQAKELAEAELDKIRFVGMSSGTVTGRRGVITLSVENKADYAVTVTLRLSGKGISLPDGDTIKQELQPGRTLVTVNVASGSGSRTLDAQLLAGESVLDEVSESLRFITLTTVLPAIIVGGVAILLGVFFLSRSLLRGRRLPLRRGKKPKSPGTPSAAKPAAQPPASAGTSPEAPVTSVTPPAATPAEPPPTPEPPAAPPLVNA